MESFVAGLFLLLLAAFPLWIAYLILTAKKRKANQKAEVTEKNTQEINLMLKRIDQSRGFVPRDDEVISDTASCPKCGCDDWKSASLVNLSGHSTTSSVTSGVGLALEEDDLTGTAFGIGLSTGEQQTKLSELAAPPTKPFSTKLWLPVSLIISVIGLLTESPFIFVIFGTIAVLLGIGKFLSPNYDQQEKEKYFKALEDYSNKRVCQRCGTFYFFKPSPDASAK